MRLVKYSFWGLLIFIMLGCAQQDSAEQLELIGHRGATGLVPENTIPGFKKALEFEVDGIEMDVVISGDDSVVVSHEPLFRHDLCLDPEGNSIDQDEQKDHLIYEMTYEQIAEYDCGSVENSNYPDQENQPLPKPLLRDVITEVQATIDENDYDPITYNIEIKSSPSWDNELQPAPEETAQLIYDVMADLEVLDQVNIFAFDPRILNAFEEIGPTLPRVYLISASQTNFEENLSRLNSTPDVYAPNYSMVNSSLIDSVHAEGMRLIPWTVNDYEDMLKLAVLGVDGIVSDYPNHFEKLRAQVESQRN